MAQTAPASAPTAEQISAHLRRHAEAVLTAYAEALHDASKRSQYVAIARRWLGSAPVDREGMTAYAKRMLERGYKPGTVDLHLRAIKRCLELVMPQVYPRWSWPGLDLNLDTTPENVYSASPEFVARLVGVARRLATDARDLAWLCLATIYGCRAGELTGFQRDYLKGDRLWIEANKHSESRWYWCPPQVRRVLERTAWTAVSERAVYDAWHRLLAQANLKAPAGSGWHVIRRGLASAFEAAGVPDPAAVRFVRWAEPGGESMRRRYAKVAVTLGATGLPQAVEAGTLRAKDGEVWARHPWLGLWG